LKSLSQPEISLLGRLELTETDPVYSRIQVHVRWDSATGARGRQEHSIGFVLQLSLAQIYQYIKGNWARISPTEVLETPVKFRTIEKIDDANPDRVATDKLEVAKGLREIVVRVERLNYQQREQMEPKREDRKRHLRGLANLPDQVPETIKEVSEKALKGRAMSHSVGYGESVLVSSAISNRRSNTKMVYIDGRDKPIGAYIFKYRFRGGSCPVSKEPLFTNMS